MAEQVTWFNRPTRPGGGTVYVRPASPPLAAFISDLREMDPHGRAMTLANAIELGVDEVAAVYERAAKAEAVDLPPLSEEKQ